jgi:hypothetical protein
MELLEIAESLEVAGYWTIPVNESKQPLTKWSVEAANAGHWQSAHGIAIRCGAASGGIECIDIEGKFLPERAQQIYSTIVSDAIVQQLAAAGDIYVQATRNKGFHIVYRYDAEIYPGSAIIAKDEEGRVLVETRAGNAYILIAPSPGYSVVSGELFALKKLTPELRDYLLAIASKAAGGSVPSQSKKNATEKNPKSGEGLNIASPWQPPDSDLAVEYLNTRVDLALTELLKAGWSIHRELDNKWELCRPGKRNDTHATLNYEGSGKLYVFSTEAPPFEVQKFYTVYEVVLLLSCRGSHVKAYDIACHHYLQLDDVAVRIGPKYFKTIFTIDRFGNRNIDLQVYTESVLKIDLRRIKKSLVDVPVLKGYTMQPCYFNGYSRVVERQFNLFAPPPHSPAQGEITWSMRMMEHVFGSQIKQGYKYLWFLFNRPKQPLPILALVSKERATGKTTFINWLAILAGANLVYLSPESLGKTFNYSYARAHIIAMEETIVNDKQSAVEKLKALSTAKRITVERKFVDEYQVDFFGHIILTSNRPDMFIQIDQEEIRFFVRHLTYPKWKNLAIEDDLRREAPAFLDYIRSLEPFDVLSRDGFSPEELDNPDLQALKKASRSAAAEDILSGLEAYFLNSSKDVIYATAGELNDQFCTKERYSNKYIARVCREELYLGNPVLMKYTPEFGYSQVARIGKVFEIRREHVLPLADKGKPPVILNKPPENEPPPDELPF